MEGEDDGYTIQMLKRRANVKQLDNLIVKMESDLNIGLLQYLEKIPC